ncbi:hypothetical protein GCM10010174_09370 [Kutzneria viridogrisea]|uniref:Uncharacterized protein n=2 Tax=Kutzneria TaxID=43356 RepID=W5WJS6_9PSEU|nr:hypothetical protein [Kutzneria albida]AHI01459.1 hypothetical protein KALB_8101 [Kutzneria albida DSM 43870]MBA8931423.1 hypothetical protein [Kutzneria viridogrisea]
MMEPTKPRTAEDWTDSLIRYRHLAAEVLATHQRANAQCVVCGQQWPCKAACAAEFVLEL